MSAFEGISDINLTPPDCPQPPSTRCQTVQEML